MRSPDFSRWSDPASYLSHWSRRAELASRLIPDGASILEIGAGAGDFRRFIQDRCKYVGSDLVPQDNTLLTLNIDADPLPDGEFDFVVLLGVLEYLYEAEAAVRKVCEASTNVVCSYCCLPKRSKSVPEGRVAELRWRAGWVNNYTLKGFVGLFEKNGFKVVSKIVYNTGSYFDHTLVHFHRST